MKAEDFLDLATLKSLLSYDSDSGIFTWKVKVGKNNLGMKAGSPQLKGYIQITIKKRRYYAHRLAWFYIHGYYPPEQIDHINRIVDDNRIENLRLASSCFNARNRNLMATNKTGVTGVCWHKRNNRYVVRVGFNRKNHYVGNFKTIEEAKSAYENFKKNLEQCFPVNEASK